MDLFLLHDPAPGGVRSDDVCAYLEDATRAGGIRARGIAGEPEPTLRVAQTLQVEPPVLQMRDDVLSPPGVATSTAAAPGRITFGVLGRALGPVVSYVGADPERRRRWHDEVGADCAAPDVAAALLLRLACATTRSGSSSWALVAPTRALSGGGDEPAGAAGGRRPGRFLQADGRASQRSAESRSQAPIIDARFLPPDVVLSADVAVVGAGAAGIVMALKLADAGFDVLLLESGGRRFDAHTQRLADASSWDSERYTPISMATRRQVGGTSVIWGGHCVPFDPIDFERRDILSGAAWPGGYDELSRYFQRACDWFVCGRAAYDGGDLAHLPPSIVPGLPNADVRTSTFER